MIARKGIRIKTKVKTTGLNKNDLLEAALDITGAAIESGKILIDASCPHCKKEVSAPSGKSQCPHCHEEIDIMPTF